MSAVPKPLPRPAEQTLVGCTIFLPRTTIRVPTGLTTLDRFRAWAKSDDAPEKAKVCFLNGEVVIDMSGEEAQTHGLLKTAVCIPLGLLVAEQDLGEFFITSILISNAKADVSNIPDAVLAKWDSLEANRVRFVPKEGSPERLLELQGTPDWVMEIVSDSSVRKDTKQLRESYHRAGIPEYWLIDARGDEINFQILLHRPRGYVAAPRRDGWQRSRVFGRQFRLERRRGRMGLWQYTLHVK